MTRDFILDFDRTLFDTEQFYVHLSDRGLRHLVGGVELFENEIDLTQFIYKDAQRFLSEQPRDRLHVVSAVAIATGDAPCEHQRKMIERSGVADQVATVELVAGEKGPVPAGCVC